MNRVVQSGSYVLGDEVESFEKRFAAYVGAVETLGVASGTDALTLALAALDLPTASSVIVCANDGGYGALASRRLGFQPVVADIDPHTGGPTARTLQQVATPDTAAVIVTHLHGNLLDLEEIDNWRRSRDLRLVEDCAQAHGLRDRERHVGLTGDLATYSFYPTKNLGGIGDGGAVAIPDGVNAEQLASRLRRLRQYGWGDRYRIDERHGQNSRLDELQAAILDVRLNYLDERNRRRIALREACQHSLEPNESCRILGWGAPSVAHHIVVATKTPAAKDRLASTLESRGVASGFHYPWLVTEMRGLWLQQHDTPGASQLRNCMISIPAEPLLTGEEQQHLMDTLSDWALNESA